MNLCDKGHDEVCYESRSCPACEEMGQLQDEINGLKDTIKDKEKEIANHVR